MKHLVTILFMGLLALPAAANPSATKWLNDLRASKGSKPVVYSQKLERAAQGHANDMAKRSFFSHAGSNGSKVGDRVRRAGYKWCFVAENIAQGQKDLGTVLNAWAGSSGHYKNMIDRKAGAFGVARGKNNNWVMVLARPC